jgi:4-oxalocrotonate tautomerase
MPFINIKLIPDGITAAKKAEVIRRVTQVMVDVLGKNPETTHVCIEEVPAESWGIGGVPVSERRKKKP